MRLLRKKDVNLICSALWLASDQHWDLVNDPAMRGCEAAKTSEEMALAMEALLKKLGHEGLK